MTAALWVIALSTVAIAIVAVAVGYAYLMPRSSFDVWTEEDVARMLAPNGNVTVMAADDAPKPDGLDWDDLLDELRP